MSTRSFLLIALTLSATSSVSAQPRNFRFFLSPIGLSDPANPQGPAADPTAQLGMTPTVVVPAGVSARLYVWAQICPPGSPNTATFNGVSRTLGVNGLGGQVTGFQSWNYRNGSFGSGAGRWQQFSQSGTSTTAAFAGAAFTAGAGVSNTSTAAALDGHYRRFATDGTTRIDTTLLGRIDVAGDQPGLLRLFFGIGSLGVIQSGQAAPDVYFGWGDEEVIDDPNPYPDALVQVVPEPEAGLLLLSFGVAAYLLRRR